MSDFINMLQYMPILLLILMLFSVGMLAAAGVLLAMGMLFAKYVRLLLDTCLWSVMTQPQHRRQTW